MNSRNEQAGYNNSPGPFRVKNMITNLALLVKNATPHDKKSYISPKTFLLSLA
jgi:hypothetical protein